MTDIELYRSEKKQAGDTYLDRFFEAYHRDVRHWALESVDADFLRTITIGPPIGRALWSNRQVRRVAQHALIDALLDEYAVAPDRRRYWVTLAWDLGVSWERNPHFDLIALRNTAQHHLRRVGLDGFGVVEFDVWKNLTGEPGRRMVAHVHFIGWPVDPVRFRRKEVQTRLRGRRALKNSLGAPSAVIKPITRSPKNIAHLAMYMMKAPAAAKNLIPHTHGRKLRSATLSRGSAARFIEVFSHIEVGDVMFAIGKGKKISSAVKREIAALMRPRIGALPAPTRDEVFQHWRSIRLANGSKKFVEPIVITRLDHRVMTEDGTG